MNTQHHKFTADQRQQMIAYEAFLRRASVSKLPFMLKGSFLTRQYFPNNISRYTNDLDFVCLIPITEVELARDLLNSWISAITDQEKEDGVRFRKFSEDSFWQRVDYAMDEDFPTVTTEVLCWIDNKEIELSIDVSLNLDVSENPVSLDYLPLEGSSFCLENTVPLSLQIAWKMHQCIVRPRLKDIFDLTYLLKHPLFDKAVLHQTLQALVNECFKGGIANSKLLELFADEMFRQNSVLKNEWKEWRINETVSDLYSIPASYSEFIRHFKRSLENAGFYNLTLSELPPATMNKNESKLKQSVNSMEEGIITKEITVKQPENIVQTDFEKDGSKRDNIQYVSFWQWCKHFLNKKPRH